MNPHLHILIEEAQKRMQKSEDHIHDMAHALRVAIYSEQIGTEMGLDQESLEIIALSSWWHDTGRTLTRKPSIVWMRMVDDFLSAFFLWKKARELKIKNSNLVSVTLRIILSHNFGTERLMSKLILPPKYRELLSIVADADTLDTLNIARVNELRLMAENSILYKQGYKFLIWWFLHTKELEFQTNWAKKHFAETVLKEFVEWFKNTEVYEWHATMFSYEWLEKRMRDGELFLSRQLPSSFNG